MKILQGMLAGLFTCRILFQYNVSLLDTIYDLPPQPPPPPPPPLASKLEVLSVRRIVNMPSFLRLDFAMYIKVNFPQDPE